MANAPRSSIERSDEEATATTPLLKRQQNDGTDRNGPQVAQSGEDIESKWKSPNNQENPRNWATWYKWITVVLVSFIEFLTTMPNFMYAPNITDAQKDLDTTDDTLATLSLTIYLLGFALGPLLFAPLSEMYGRAIVYRCCVVVFLGMTVGCALASTIGMLVVFRFLAGGFGAAPVAIGGAVVGDLFDVENRGTAMSVYQAGLIISAVVGPPIGGLIGSHTNWRWVFWIVCIMAAFASLCSLAVLRETHAPTLKRRNYRQYANDLTRHESESKASNLATELKNALSRPVKLLVKSPVVFGSCLLIFVIIGILNVFLTLMSRVYQQVYDFSSGESSWAYLGLALGFVAASALFGATNDRIMHRLARNHSGDSIPEFRLPATIAAMPLIVVGLLWYGWSLHFKAPWIVPIVGSGLAGLGITTVQLSITTYLIDSFDEYSASALAAITMARSVGGAVLPLLGPSLYKKLGYGWGNSVLALINIVCCAIPVLMYIFGPRWRAMFSTNDL